MFICNYSPKQRLRMFKPDKDSVEQRVKQQTAANLSTTTYSTMKTDGPLTNVCSN